MLGECLHGTRALDLSQYLPGPFATQMLADLGADVLKVEPLAGDPMRTFLLRDPDGISPLYRQVNAGKRVLRLDLKDRAGREAFARLVTGADVLLESFRPGVLERLGFGRAELTALNPALVHCALSGFGQTGPCRLRGGHDLTYVALSGGLGATGTAETPVMTFPPLADHAGAMQAVIAILGALLRRDRSGAGAYLDVSLFETALGWQAVGLATARREAGALQRGRGLLTGGAAYYQVYATADGRFMALAAIEEKFWQAFCAAVERPDWSPRQHEPLPQQGLIAELAALFAGRPFAEWCRLAQRVDCCLEPVLDYREVADHPQVRQRRLLRTPGGGDVPAEVLFPAWFDDFPPPSRFPLQEVSLAEALAAWE